MSGSKEKTFPERLKNFFKLTKAPHGSQGQGLGLPRLKTEVFALTREATADIGPETPTAQRIRALRDLGEIVSSKRLEDNACETLWVLINDMFKPTSATEERHAALIFLKNLVVGQYDKLGPLRVKIFNMIKESSSTEDVQLLVELLKALTDSGKDLLYLDEGISSFLIQIIPRIARTHQITDFLQFLSNIIKFNTAYLDADAVDSVVCYLSHAASSSSNIEEISAVVAVLDAVVCYGNLPNESIPVFASTLCRLVILKQLTKECWRVMRNILGTHLGPVTLYALIHFLETSDDSTTILGAIFFISMGLWSGNKPLNLEQSPTIVLPALQGALTRCLHPLVSFEAALALHKLVKFCSGKLTSLGWDLVLGVLDKLTQHAKIYPKAVPSVQDVVTEIELLVDSGSFLGSLELFYGIVEANLEHRDSSSSLRLINFYANKLSPEKPKWLSTLNWLMTKFFVQGKDFKSRMKMLGILQNVVSSHRVAYEDELVELIVLPSMQNIHQETHGTLRRESVDLLVSLCLQCSTKHFLALLGVLEKILERPFILEQGEVVNIPSDEDLSDVLACINGLVEIFKQKMFHLPTGHAIEVYKLLVSQVKSYYEKSFFCETATSVRIALLDFILSIRADGEYRMGFLGIPRYSPYLLVDHKHGEKLVRPKDVARNAEDTPNTSASQVHNITTYMSLGEACVAVIRCLRCERDWRVLKMVLDKIPHILSNKALILSRNSNEIDYVAKALCCLISDHKLNNPETITNAPAKFSRGEFLQSVFPVVTSLASYHAHLKAEAQLKLVLSLEVGFKYKDKASMTALTISALEMRDTMYKLLPEVLLNLSKVSATIALATPILEFLSTLIRLPEVYLSFTEKQYLLVFVIALPYTNPFKFNHYVVSLAHHVIALWFLKCKLSLRKNFVRPVVQGLKNNVLIPCGEEMANQGLLAGANEDSAMRARSSSLSSQDARRTAARQLGEPLPRPHHDEALLTYHTELTETCVDLMARYAFASCTPLPQKCESVRKLIKNGPSQSWLVGHTIVTVTTSPCNKIATKSGLCDKCRVVCAKHPEESEIVTEEEKAAAAPPSLAETMSSRRRHHSAATSLVNPPQPLNSAAQTVEVKRAEDPQAKMRLRHKSSFEERRVQKEGEEVHQQDYLGLESTSMQDVSDIKCNIPAQTPCTCCCSGWAQIHIRRPTGDTSWVLRVLNASQNLNDILLASGVSADALPNLADMFATASTLGEVADASERPEDPASKDGATRPTIPRQTSMKELSSVARKSCDAIPEESKDLDAGKTELVGEFVRAPRDRVYTMPSSVGYRRTMSDTIRTSDPGGLLSREVSSISTTNPSFVFLQLFYTPLMSVVSGGGIREGVDSAWPILIPQNQPMVRALKNLDRIPPFETHKIGVIYVGRGQANKEYEILGNRFGSLRYAEFLQNIGQLICLRAVDPQGTFLGGLDVSGADGKFAYMWKDDVIQVIFHTATLMPADENDPQCNNKKRHIGNDFVTIVYNESGEEYQLGTIRGQFNYACVVVEPLDHATNRVTLKCRPELCELMGAHVEPKLVSDRNVSLLARQMALHANLGALIHQHPDPSAPYASSWLERLRLIKRLKKRLLTEDSTKDRDRVGTPGLQRLSTTLDFTELSCYKPQS